MKKKIQKDWQKINGKWHHLVRAVDGTSYMDGVKVKWFLGQITDVEVFDRALSPIEIAAEFEKGMKLK